MNTTNINGSKNSITPAAAECITLQAAAGFNIHLFPTGQGNIVGNPIEPVVKLTANPITVAGMGEHIDCDVSKILSREMNLDQAGDELIKSMLRVANGRLTCAEALGHKEFVMTKLYRSDLRLILERIDLAIVGRILVVPRRSVVLSLGWSSSSSMLLSSIKAG